MARRFQEITEVYRQEIAALAISALCLPEL